MQEIEWNKLPSHSLNLKIYISIKFDHKIQRFIGYDEDLLKTINVCVLLPCEFLFATLPLASISHRKSLNSSSCDCPPAAQDSFSLACIHKSHERYLSISHLWPKSFAKVFFSHLNCVVSMYLCRLHTFKLKRWDKCHQHDLGTVFDGRVKNFTLSSSHPLKDVKRNQRSFNRSDVRSLGSVHKKRLIGGRGGGRSECAKHFIRQWSFST